MTALIFGGLIGGGGGNWLTNNGTPYAAYNSIRASQWETSLLDVSGNNRHIVSFAGDSSMWATGTGWTFNGSNQRLTLPFGIDSDWTFGIKYSDVTNTGFLFGAAVSGSNPTFQLQPDFLNDFTWNWGTGSLVDTEVLTGTVICSGNSFYHDGSLVGTSSGTFTGGPTDNLDIGARFTTTHTGFCACKIQSVIVYNKTLTAGEVNILHTDLGNL